MENVIKTNCSSGEITPYMGGRPDVEHYQNGAAKVHNFNIRPHGGLIRRLPTKYLASVQDPLRKTALIPFQFSNEQAYVLEFGHLKMRIFKDEELVENPPATILEITTTYDENDVAELYWAQAADYLYLFHSGYPPRRVARTSDTAWSIENVPFEDGPYMSAFDSREITAKLTSINRTATITSTVAEFAIGDIGKFVEYYSDGYLQLAEITGFTSTTVVTVEPKDNVVDLNSIDQSSVIDYAAAPNRLRSTVAIWSSETENHYIKVSGTWYLTGSHQAAPEQLGVSPDTYGTDVMTVSATPTMLATTGTLSLSGDTITATVNLSVDTLNDPRDIGRHMRFTFNNSIVWGKITSISNAKTAALLLGNMVPRDPTDPTTYKSNATTTNWQFGSLFVGNYPRCGTFHEQRLIMGSTPAEPNYIWFSNSGDFVSFSPSNLLAEILDSNGFTISVGSGEVSTVLWLQSGPVLLAGTNGDEYQIKASTINESLSPTNRNVSSQTSYGSRSIRPFKVGPSTLYVQRHGISLRELSYDFEIDSFIATDATIISEHILRKHGYVVDMAYQQVPNSIIWCVMSDGALVSLTYDKAQRVYAWSDHEIGQGYVESVATIPSTDESHDQVYVVVRRTIDSVTARYVEVMAPNFYPSTPDDKDGMVYLDSFKLYEGVATTTITGLAHLEGEEVGVLANGAVHPNRTVSGGQITLDYAATRVYAGFNYTSILQTLPTEGGSPIGTAMGKRKKVVRLQLRVLDSIGFKIGSSLDTLTAKVFRDSATPHGSSPDLFSGIKEFVWNSGWDRDGQYFIVQDQPYPLNVLSLMPVQKTNE